MLGWVLTAKQAKRDLEGKISANSPHQAPESDWILLGILMTQWHLGHTKENMGGLKEVSAWVYRAGVAEEGAPL